MRFRGGISVGTQLEGRAPSVSPRDLMHEPRGHPWVLSFGGGESSGPVDLLEAIRRFLAPLPK